MSTQAPDQRVEVYPGKEALVRFDPDRTFTCVDECSWCCERGVLLYDADLFELAELESLAETTTSIHGHPFVDRAPKENRQHRGPDGKACVFLTDEGRCHLHAEHAWKPTRCSVFPLDVSVEDGSIVVDIRDDAETNCEGLDVSERRLIDHLDAFLPPIVWELTDPTTSIEL